MVKSYAPKNSGIEKKKDRRHRRKETPEQASVFSGILTMQRWIGNQAVQRFMHNPAEGPADLGGRIKVNTPGDRHEREAERIEKKVMGANASMGSDSSHAGMADKTSMTQQMPAAAFQQPLGRHDSGKQLHPEDRRFFEARFGFDFNSVRIHSSRSAAGSARALASRAYTMGTDITFGADEYRPRTREGRRLIAHELAHVVQQARGRGFRSENGLAETLSPAPSHQAQRTMIATGDPAGFASLANSIIAVQFEVVVSPAGVVSIRTTDVQGPPTPAAQELVAVLRSVINNTNTTTIEFIHGTTSTRASDRRVMIGSYPQGKVDLDDIEQFGFGVGTGISAGSALVHEIQEQFRKQVHGEAFGPAHASGISAEERAAGATRGAATSRTISATTTEITVPYTYPDGRIVDVTFRVTNGNVTSVTRRTRRTP